MTKEICFKSIKKLRNRDCKRISVMSIDAKFNGKNAPKNRSRVIERSFSELQTRRIRRMSGLRTLKAKKAKKRTMITWLIRNENFVGKRLDFTANYLISCKPQK